ncbi:aminopeptidase O isoform X3 [Carassius gibelio]|uniref:aminopeptidase O isoform X3 n=1 Tax=Carassius gibelio TaxID=101364 RepID=UPI00227931D0|nr:aminopeptidase O isoform X3 [Carassius gibelio]
MESNRDLDPNKDDLPLRANTNHMLVRHYVLDLTVHFQRKVIGGSIVLFLEPGVVSSKHGELGDISNTPVQNLSQVSSKHDVSSPITPEPNKVIPPEEPSCLCGGNDVSSVLWGDESEEFTLVLDCCDLTVSKVEELDVTTVADLKKLDVDQQHANTDLQSSSLVQRLVSMPSVSWRLQHELYMQCSRSPTVHNAQPLRFHTDRWSLQIRKEGVCTPRDFPHAVRIWYETNLTGGSVRWTNDQDARCCVYTMGSPINNRALFPCQEPPVAMSTWQARVRAPCDYTVLMSGENQAFPKPAETGFLQWDYYVTMPMPASTFTIAVGQWLEAGVKHPNFEVEKTDKPYNKELSVSLDNDDQQYVCSHMDYPCRFMASAARTQTVIPHRVFAPPCHLQKANDMVLPLLPLCLTAAHSVLGVHPFSRLDVLIVPSGFSSLGMARPNKENTGEVSESGASVVKHALNPEKPFMQVHYLKGYFLLKFLADQVGEKKFLDFFKVFVGKFHGQLILSQDFLQMLLDTFPGMSSRSITLEAIFSDWLDTPEMPEWLRDSCSEWLRTPVVQEVKEEVAKWIHFSGSAGKGSKRKRAGPKVNFKELSPEQLVLLLEFLLEEPMLSLSMLRLLQTTYNLQAQDAEVKHRWCELAVKHKHTAAYRDVEQFLIHDQAMGVYLYGELMVQEDARQQALARRCLSLIKDDMDQSACRVVEEMIL